MINPLSGINTNPLASNFGPVTGNVPQNSNGSLGDLASLSPEAGGPESGLQQLAQELMKALGGQQDQQQEDPIQALQKEIAKTEKELEKAQAAGDEPKVKELSQKLEQLKAQLAQLMGQGGEQGGAPGGGDQGAGSPGGGSPGGGSPGGGSPGGASPGGGSPGGGSPSASSPGGGSPGGGSPGGGSPGGGSPSVGGNDNGGGAPSDVSAIPPELAGDDKKLSEFIESKLAGTPLAGKGLGAHFVAAGRKHDVDPMVLAAISRHETNFGKLGVGVSKHMGVGAFDSSPNKPRKWDGAVNQIYSGAKTFANLRRKGGSNSRDPLGTQLSAVNRAGWATDGGWHRKVGNHYSSLSRGAGNTRVASSSPSTSTRRS